MKYLLSKQFTQIAETTGTIQNSSHVGTIEMSNSNTPDSGILIYPLQKVSFNDKTIYLRCIDGYAEARVLPFELVQRGGDSSSGTMPILEDAFRSLAVAGNTVSFYGSKDGSGTALFSFDFPEELALQQLGTEIVENFAWSNATYPDSTNPNLDGKTVLVLAVKGDKQTGATVKYSFVDMAKVIKAISEGDSSIRVNGYAINVRISAETGNLLKLKNDGLFVGSDDTKADKVANATAGNLATLDANGNLVDSTVALTTLLNQSVASGNNILDTVPASVNGGLWYEIDSNTPVIKIYHNGLVYNIANGSSDPTPVDPTPTPDPTDPNAQYLIVDSPFTTDLTDNCGIVWLPQDGAVTVSDGAAQFNRSYLRGDQKITFGGQDFTIAFDAKINSIDAWTGIFSTAIDAGDYFGEFTLISNTSNQMVSTAHNSTKTTRLWEETLTVNVFDGNWYRFEMDYVHANSTFKIFVDGQLNITANSSIERLERDIFLAANANDYRYGTRLVGAMRNVKVYDGVALHTENFTPE